MQIRSQASPSLRDPGSRGVHSVHFYDADEALIQRLQSVVVSGLEDGNSILMVATEEHRRQLAAALRKRGYDVPRLESDTTLAFFDAHETLALLMMDGKLDRDRFLRLLSELIGSAKLVARNGNASVTVFGEMVAILW